MTVTRFSFFGWWAGAVAVLVLAGACASAPPPDLSSELHADFAKLRPVTLALRVEPASPGLEEAVYHALIDRGYSVLAPGETAGAEAGVFRVRASSEGSRRKVEGRMDSPTGEVLYRMTVSATPADDRELAGWLLLDLPRK